LAIASAHLARCENGKSPSGEKIVDCHKHVLDEMWSSSTQLVAKRLAEATAKAKDNDTNANAKADDDNNKIGSRRRVMCR
jgi:hypothetical protein